MNPKFEIVSSEELLNHPRQRIVSDKLVFESGIEYEYVYRKTEGKRVVFIVAIKDDDQCRPLSLANFLCFDKIRSIFRNKPDFPTQKHVVLVRQYRHPLRREVLDIPGGIVEDGESFEEAALRELREETGYIGQSAELIGKLAVNPAASDLLVRFCLVRYVKKVGEPMNTDTEQTTPVLMSLSEVGQVLSDGEIESVFSAAGLMLAMSYLNNNH